MTLNVMVLESDRGVADAAIKELTDAGHVVLRCHDPGSTVFPCNGIGERSSCPLESQVVDVALTVRSGHRTQPTDREDGVRCSLMHRVPLVVAGAAVLDPYAQYETLVLDRTDDVVGACEEVAAGELPRHSKIATDALRAARASREPFADARASVTRRRGYLLATVTSIESATREQREAAIVRMTAKLRAYDPSARGLDVVVGDQSRVAPTETRHST
jgi:hypothetical protein